jgi:hypothetical protein
MPPKPLRQLAFDAQTRCRYSINARRSQTRSGWQGTMALMTTPQGPSRGDSPEWNRPFRPPGRSRGSVPPGPQPAPPSGSRPDRFPRPVGHTDQRRRRIDHSRPAAHRLRRCIRRPRGSISPARHQDSPSRPPRACPLSRPGGRSRPEADAACSAPGGRWLLSWPSCWW